MTIMRGIRDVTGSGELCPHGMIATLLQSYEIQCDSTWQFLAVCENIIIFSQFGCIVAP